MISAAMISAAGLCRIVPSLGLSKYCLLLLLGPAHSVLASSPGFICEPAMIFHQHCWLHLWICYGLPTSIPGFIGESAVFLKALLASSMHL
jgi:hypothetical protein